MKLYLISLFILFKGALFAQSNYWVRFNDSQTGVSKYSELKKVAYSQWLDMFVYELEKSQRDKLEEDPNIIEITKVKNLYTLNSSSNLASTYSYTLSELNCDTLYNLGLKGAKVKIGIVDAGFSNANTADALSHLFDNNKIDDVKDFRPQKDSNFYSKNSFGDDHGTKVFQKIAGVKNNQLSGIATEATFYLAISESNEKEDRMEEYAWIEALEWFHSKGVRLVNSSLGYSNRFDDKNENYTLSEMDGNTTVISKAAKIAIEDKGMIIVNSMGNEGNKKWKYVVAPADVESVISVGSNRKDKTKVGYSSIGLPNGVSKPDFTCFAHDGTSFSAPYITGLVAQLLSYDSSLTSSEIKTALNQSAHLYPFKNNYIGYGVPDGQKALKIIKGQPIKYDTLTLNAKHHLLLNLEEKTTQLNVYHKVNKTDVIEQIHLDLKRNSNHQIKLKKRNKLYLRKPKGGTKISTIDLTTKVIEVNWK